MTLPGPAFQECTGSCHEYVPHQRPYHLIRIGQDRDCRHLGTVSTIKPVTHCCLSMSLCAVGCILQTKLTSLDTYSSQDSPSVTILSASPVKTLVHCVMKHSRPPDLKFSSIVSLPFAWITWPS